VATATAVFQAGLRVDTDRIARGEFRRTRERLAATAAATSTHRADVATATTVRPVEEWVGAGAATDRIARRTFAGAASTHLAAGAGGATAAAVHHVELHGHARPSASHEPGRAGCERQARGAAARLLAAASATAAAAVLEVTRHVDADGAAQHPRRGTGSSVAGRRRVGAGHHRVGGNIGQPVDHGWGVLAERHVWHDVQHRCDLFGRIHRSCVHGRVDSGKSHVHRRVDRSGSVARTDVVPLDVLLCTAISRRRGVRT